MFEEWHANAYSPIRVGFKPVARIGFRIVLAAAFLNLLPAESPHFIRE
jgi:hypothetical protein